jgi:Transcriptional regulator, AbiEi antitoxin
MLAGSVGDNFRLAKEIARAAARQLGNVTRAQLRAIGLDDAAIHRRVRAGLLHRVHPGVYAVGRPPITPLERAAAAVLACGPGAVLSHGSALTLWGIWKRWETPFDVTLTVDRRPRGINVHRVGRLDRRDITRHLGIPVTTLARTLLDQAPQMPPKSLTRAINDGRLNGQLHPAALADVVSRHPRHPGRGALEAILGAGGDRPTRSSFEDAFPAFCERYGLPAPQMNTIVCGHEVDALFAEEKVIVELDSWTYHSSPTSFEGDRDRDADMAAEGFLTVRVTRERFERTPQHEAARLMAILARRRARAA